jgi:hypothetical protein
LSDFSGDLSDEACSDIDLLSGKLAKSEAAIQDHAIGTPCCHALSALIADSATVPRASPHKR